MAWLYLFFAGLLEIVWVYALKQSNGFTRIWPTAFMALAMAGSFWLLAAAMRTLSLGTAYAVWTGIGTLGAFLVGIAILGEEANGGRILAAALILSGLILMKLSDSPS